MKRRRFTSSDIPKTFSLERYDVCSTWGVSEWRAALSWRYPVIIFAQDDDSGFADEEDGDVLVELRDAALAYFENPAGDPEFIMHSALVTPAIRDLTGMDLFHGFFNIDNPEYEPIARIAKRHVSEPNMASAATRALRSMTAWSIYREVDSAGDRFCIEVNLGDSDDEIVKEFKRWLRSTRKEAGLRAIPKRFEHEDFRDWADKRLLPYIDLTLWARGNGGQLTAAAIANALFPDEVDKDVVSHIRKTVAPAAKLLCQLPVISTLTLSDDKVERKTQRFSSSTSEQ